MPAFHVQQSCVIEAPLPAVRDLIVDFGQWTKWSPWLCADRNAQVEITQPANSVGSIYRWDGKVVGVGEIEHQRVDASRIEQELRFLKPFKSTSFVSFDFQSVNSGTMVTWAMRGSLPWFLFFMKSHMETFIAMDYQRGLRMIKDLAETGSVLSQTDVLGTVPVPTRKVIGIRASCFMSEVGESMDATFAEVQRQLQSYGISTSGEMISVYHPTSSLKEQRFDYTSGYVVQSLGSRQTGKLVSLELPAANAFHVRHMGSYRHLGNAWSTANTVARHQKIKLSRKADNYEIYANSPTETEESALQTDIFLPLR